MLYFQRYNGQDNKPGQSAKLKRIACCITTVLNLTIYFALLLSNICVSHLNFIYFFIFFLNDSSSSNFFFHGVAQFQSLLALVLVLCVLLLMFCHMPLFWYHVFPVLGLFTKCVHLFSVYSS